MPDPPKGARDYSGLGQPRLRDVPVGGDPATVRLGRDPAFAKILFRKRGWRMNRRARKQRSEVRAHVGAVGQDVPGRMTDEERKRVRDSAFGEGVRSREADVRLVQSEFDRLRKTVAEFEKESGIRIPHWMGGGIWAGR